MERRGGDFLFSPVLDEWLKHSEDQCVWLPHSVCELWEVCITWGWPLLVSATDPINVQGLTRHYRSDARCVALSQVPAAIARAVG